MKLYDLPQNWKWISVRNMGSQDRPVLKAGPFGSLLKKSDYTLSGFRVYGQEQVIAGDLKIGNYYISEKKFKSLESCSVKSGDILMSLVGSFGKTLIVPDEFEPGIINPRLLRISLDSEKFNPDFFCYFVQSRFAQTQINLMSHGGTMGILNAKNVGELLLPVPPIAQQKRIAAILDKADAVRRKRREAIRLTEELLRSTFLEMFGDPITNPKGWDVVAFENLIKGKLHNGVFRKNQDYSSKGSPVVWVKDLFDFSPLNGTTEKCIQATSAEIQKFTLTYGDILFCRSSLKQEGVGYSNVFLGNSSEVLFECHLIKASVDIDRADPVFLNFLLRSEGMRKSMILSSNTVTMSTLSQEQLKKLRLFLPPISLQARFRQLFDKVCQSRQCMNHQIQEAENLFNSLLQRAFTGDL